MDKRLVALISVVIVGFAIGGGIALSRHSSTPAYNCIAGPGEQCASDLFYADYQRWKALATDIQKESQSKEAKDLQDNNDQFNGMTMRLKQAIPAGYVWDEKKLRFVQTPPPLEQKAASPAVNAPTPSPVTKPALPVPPKK